VLEFRTDESIAGIGRVYMQPDVEGDLWRPLKRRQGITDARQVVKWADGRRAESSAHEEGDQVVMDVFL